MDLSPMRYKSYTLSLIHISPSVTVESGAVTLPSPAGVRALVVSTAEDGTAVLCL